jgi:hypothetical protein
MPAEANARAAALKAIKERPEAANGIRAHFEKLYGKPL